MAERTVQAPSHLLSLSGQSFLTGSRKFCAFEFLTWALQAASGEAAEFEHWGCSGFPVGTVKATKAQLLPLREAETAGDIRRGERVVGWGFRSS